MGKIFASGELERSAVVKEIMITAQSGARGLSEEKALYYNLDAIAESHIFHERCVPYFYRTFGNQLTVNEFDALHRKIIGN